MNAGSDMTGRLQNKIAIVTGGASGIGEAICRLFSSEGAHVVVADIQRPAGEALAREIGGEFLQLDVTDEDAWSQGVRQVVERNGRLDVLVNNAGVLITQPIEETTIEAWNRQMAINLTGPMLGCKHAILAMRDNPGGPRGAIVNVVSIAGLRGLAFAPGYSASKGGATLLTKSVAIHCSKLYRDIRCNSLHPGTIDTPMNHALFEKSGDPQAMRAAFDALQPIGRMARPEEMAKAALFLASDDASYLSGAELVADGGSIAGLAL
jgi:NAD(P)-dependent dehydrogenase (short-subunit alcohol dehydrogenase family)